VEFLKGKNPAKRFLLDILRGCPKSKYPRHCEEERRSNLLTFKACEFRDSFTPFGMTTFGDIPLILFNSFGVVIKAPKRSGENNPGCTPGTGKRKY